MPTPAPTATPAATPTPALTAAKFFVADGCTQAVTSYAAGSSGNASPVAPSTGMCDPVVIALDPAGNLYVSGGMGGGQTVSDVEDVNVYPQGSKGNTPPSATIGGANSGFQEISGLAFDRAGNLYVADTGFAGIKVFAAGSNGDIAPISTSSGSNTGLSIPQGVALDSSGNIYVSDVNSTGAPQILVFAAGSNGNAAPIATISGSNTGLTGAGRLAVDASGRLYVLNAGSQILVFAPGSNGNVAPVATISGSNTGLDNAQGLAVDSADNIYAVGQYPGNPTGLQSSVTVYPAGSNGNVTPSATITGSNAGLNYSLDVAVDAVGQIYVSTISAPIINGIGGSPEVRVFPAGPSGNPDNEAPSLVLGASQITGIFGVTGLALDSSDQIYVTSSVSTSASQFSSVTVYPAGSDGNVAPIATISGSSTLLNEPASIAVDAAGNIYVGDYQAIEIYAAGSNGNAAPIARISGTNTGLSAVVSGLAVDSAGQIYAINSFGNQVLIFAAGSNGNVAPSAIISGSNTFLYQTMAITLDTAGNIYVAALDVPNQFNPDVLTFAAGSSGNVSPTAIIEQSLNFEFKGVAVDSAGNIYVTVNGNDGKEVEVFTPAPIGYTLGVIIGGIGTQLFEPTHIAIAP